MNGSNGQAGLVIGVAAPQDSLHLQASQATSSGSSGFRQALDSAAGDDKKDQLKQKDSGLLGASRGFGFEKTAARDDGAKLNVPHDNASARGANGLERTGPETIDVESKLAVVSGNELPVVERQTLPVRGHFVGTRPEISTVDTPHREALADSTRLASALDVIKTAASNPVGGEASQSSTTQAVTGREPMVSRFALAKESTMGSSPSGAEAKPFLAMSQDRVALQMPSSEEPALNIAVSRVPEAALEQGAMNRTFAQPALNQMSVKDLMKPGSGAELNRDVVPSGLKGSGLEFVLGASAARDHHSGITSDGRLEAAVGQRTSAQVANGVFGAASDPSRTPPLVINDLDPSKMNRMSLDGTAASIGTASERVSPLGSNRIEALRGQLERTRFSQSVDGERAAKAMDAFTRLAKVEALVSELSSQTVSKPASMLVSSAPTSSFLGAVTSAGDLSLASMPSGGLSGQSSSIVTPSLAAAGVVNAKIDNSAWIEQIANHAKMAIKQDLKSVEIKLTPAHLGTIEILVAQDDESTQLAFFTKHAHVREALESQLARLQKFFQDDGLELSDAWVSDQSLAEHRERQNASEQSDAWALDMGADQGLDAEIPNHLAEQRYRPNPDRQLDVWA
jgi:hypothetical protein